MDKMNLDYAIYLVTDERFCGEEAFFSVIEQAILGGTTIIQLREKTSSTFDFYHTALKLKSITENYNIPLIINDRLDIALAVDAAGVHLGQSDMPYDIARKILGKDKIIGLSVNSYDDIEKANQTDVDYLGLSPIFHTDTKTDIGKPFGLEGLKKAKAMTNIPLVAIGGINFENAKDVYSAGADGLAIVSAIMGAENPQFAAQKIAYINTHKS